jgi:hypothetical protein
MNALIFIDPDTGLETGTPSYLRKMGREKYILNSELSCLFENLDKTSVLMIYQHLPNNKHIHQESVLKIINQAIASTGCQYIQAYREDDLTFIFIMKSNVIYKSISKLLNIYHEQSGHQYKSMHHAPKRDRKGVLIPLPPTPPGMRVRTGRLPRMSDRSRTS